MVVVVVGAVCTPSPTDVCRMHVMAGKKPADADEATLKKIEETFISNMTYAADRLQKVSC